MRPLLNPKLDEFSFFAQKFNCLLILLFFSILYFTNFLYTDFILIPFKLLLIYCKLVYSYRFINSFTIFILLLI